MTRTYLHDNPNFNDLINIISNEMDIPSTLVEKDYWIMHCLYGLQQAEKTFYLKGGTSLSKGFQIIDRFSEDIDILIEPQADQDVKYGKNQDKPLHRESRKKYYNDLSTELTIDGIDEIVRDTAFDDKSGKYRSAGIRLHYKTSRHTPEDLKEGVLLEVGFDKIEPHRPVTISSWAYDYAKEKKLLYIDNRAKNVSCYLPSYTFVEKLHAINKKFAQEQNGKGFDANFMRHYYDLYKLLGVKEVTDFIGTEEYSEYKNIRFKGKELNQATHLDDPKVFKAYEERYEKSKTLYYKDKPQFKEIMKSLRDFSENMSSYKEVSDFSKPEQSIKASESPLEKRDAVSNNLEDKETSILSDDIKPSDNMSVAERALERMKNPSKNSHQENEKRITGFSKSVDDRGIEI